MRRSHSILAAAGLVTLISLPASAEQFRYRFRPGQVIQQRVSVAGATMMGAVGGNMMKAQFRAVSRQTQRVRSVAGGTVTLEITETPLSGSMTAFGQTEQMKAPPEKSIVRLTERGRFLSRKVVGATGASGAGEGGMEAASALYGLNFPARDLKPGDTWEETLEVETDQGPQRVRMACKFVGREKFRGRTCARITATIASSLAVPEVEPAGETEPAFRPTGKLTGSVTTYFDPAAGIEVYSSGSFVVVSRVDLSGLSPEAGEVASVMKVNFVQSLASGAPAKK